MKTPNLLAPWFGFFLLLSSLFPLGAAQGAEFRLVPSLALRQEYNDNIFLTPKNTQEITRDYISIISPGLELVHKTEQTDLSLLARVDRREYWEQTDLSATDQTYRGNLGLALTPKFRLLGRAAYIQDSSPDRDIETTGLVLLPLKRERQAYGGGAEYNLTEKTMAALSYDYNKDDYRSVGAIDMESNAASLGLIHDLSSLIHATKMRLNVSAGRYRYTGLQVDTVGGTVGLSKQLAELWNVSVDAGGRYTVSEFDVVTLQFIPPSTFVPVTQKEKTYETGWIGQAAVSYRGEKTNAGLTLGYDLAPASGFVGATQRTSALFNISRRFTYEWRGLFYAYYYWNKAEKGTFSAQEIDEQLLSLSPTLRYEPIKDVALEASYLFTIVWYRAREPNEEAKRNLFMLRLILQHAFFE